jgi:hypothetical protein
MFSFFSENNNFQIFFVQSKSRGNSTKQQLPKNMIVTKANTLEIIYGTVIGYLIVQII